jgi:hypothetical protein
MAIRIHNLETGTFPCVLHHGGGDALCAQGLELKRAFFALIAGPRGHFHLSKSGRPRGLQTYPLPSRPARLRRLPDLSIVTWTSYRFPGSAELSLAHHGVAIDLFHPRGRWRNIRKLRLMRDYLERIDTRYVLFLDSHDTFVTSDIAHVVDAFGKLGVRMLFQADAHDWPSSEPLRGYYDGIAPPGASLRYLCSGIFMGEVDFVKRVVDRALATEPLLEHDDQGVYKQVFREFQPDVQLDYWCELFQPIELRLELRFQQDAKAVPGPLALTASKLARFVPYRMAGWRDALLDRLRRTGRPGT